MVIKPQSNKKTILFDFDGVLIDSFQSIFAANKEYPQMADLTKEEYRGYYAGNFFESFSKRNKNKQITDEQFYKAYIPKFSQLPALGGIQEALEALFRDYRLVIISSTVSSSIKKWLVDRKLAHFFAEIMGADVRKSKVEKVNMVFKKYKIKASDCVFITDTLGDVLEARKAGITSLAVTYGFHDKKTLQKGRPVGFIETPRDMVGEVEKYWGKHGTKII